MYNFEVLLLKIQWYMKNTNIFGAIIIFLFFMASCDKNSEESNSNVNINELIEINLKKITIDEGITGTLYQKEGNCMPPIIDENSTCKTFPIKRKILVYEYTKTSQVDGYGPVFNAISTRKIAETESDYLGFYEIKLSPGTYSVFILEKGNLYANLFDGQGGINPVEITNDSLSIEHQKLDYAVY